jgi:hypothetical protein
MVRCAASAKPNNSCFMTTPIIGLCVSQQGLIRGTFVTGSKSFARGPMRKQLRAPRGIDFCVQWRCVKGAQKFCNIMTHVAQV